MFNLQLNHTGRESLECRSELFWESIRDHLEVQGKALRPMIEKELEYRERERDVQIEGAVNELKVAGTALYQVVHVLKKRLRIDGSDRLIE